jgi:hypothetical protein
MTIQQKIAYFTLSLVPGHLLVVAKDIALQKGLNQGGYHLVVDEDYRTVRFNAIHIFGRALHHMLWPTGPGSRL